MDSKRKLAILGGGNIGLSIVNGIQNSGLFEPQNIYITRRNAETLDAYKEKGHLVTSDNLEAVRNSDFIIIAVQPKQLDELLAGIDQALIAGKHLIISVVSGASISSIREKINKDIPVIRAMPNTAIAIRESMTCLASLNKTDFGLKIAKEIFDQLGKTLVIDEELMIPATALCACGIAFFLRAVRAASQGGIEIGFHSDDALFMSAQTAKGAAALLLSKGDHPETQVDKVTTPKGCTISGLNQMEHQGFSSAMIRGIVTSAEKASKLY